MAQRVPGLSLDMDASNGLYALGFFTGMTEEINTSRFTSSVLEYSHGILSNEFDSYLDQIAANAPFRFEHMYDGDTPGVASKRLWEHSLRGRGAQREATFNFKLSQEPMPTAAERAQDPNEPLSLVDEKDIAQLAEQGNKEYVFRNKAMMSEYGLTVHITPKEAQALFVPSGSPTKPFYFAQSITQRAGSPEQVGAFTGAWTQWWSSVAPGIFADTVQKTVEKNLGRTAQEATNGRNRRKTVGLNVANDADAAFLAGRDLAQARIRAGARSMAAAGRYSKKYGEDWY